MKPTLTKDHEGNYFILWLERCAKALDGIPDPKEFFEAAKELYFVCNKFFSFPQSIIQKEILDALTNFESALKGGQGA